MKKLPDRDAFKLWMNENQLGRHNLNKGQQQMLISRIYMGRKKPYGGDPFSHKASGNGYHMNSQDKTGK